MLGNAPVSNSARNSGPKFLHSVRKEIIASYHKCNQLLGLRGKLLFQIRF